jgi:phosphatidylglycerophosphate synthase
MVLSVRTGLSAAAMGARGLRPADRVTLLRAVLAGGVAALTAISLAGHSAPTALVALSAVALVLDAVDGWVARRTEPTAFGARFDLEVDAFLILVLSVYVARTAGGWVLAIGVMRYAFVMFGWLLPWLHGWPPPRYWCKVVAAIQGIVLVFAAADVLPRSVIRLALVVALALLTESFGREVWWLWRHREADSCGSTVLSISRGGVRAAVGGCASVGSGLLVWFALLVPDQIGDLTPGAFLRIPVEALIVVGLALVLPDVARRVAAALGGVVLALLTIVKVLDMGFFEELDRPFNLVGDWGYLGPAFGVLRDSVGHDAALGFVVGVVVLVIALLVLMPLSVMRLTGLAAQHRAGSSRAVAALGVVWASSALFGTQIVPGDPVASASVAGLAYDQVIQVRRAVHDRQVFATMSAQDPFRSTPANDLLTGLRGKDVIVAFVESYGRVAVEGSSVSPGVDAVLGSGTRRLQAAGFSTRSAFLTSPTFGGISWLAHSTLQSGLWVDSQQRYDQLVASRRLTLSDAFARAGWRTVSDVPSNGGDWPEGTSFYHYDKQYNLGNVGYQGPTFSYASMPDQYTLSAFQRLELARANRRPVMAEIDLVSSHTPWTPIPHMVRWKSLGNGSVFEGMPGQGQSPAEVWRSSDRVQAAYGRSIQYSLNALISFVQTYGDGKLVLVLLGDHQPATVVTGNGASHDVPITIVARDPAVMQRISGWHWQTGMLPGPGAPVWPMSAFRDRFLSAFDATPSAMSLSAVNR